MDSEFSKKCCRCNKVLHTEEEFGINSKSNELFNQCVQCRLKQKVYYENNKQKNMERKSIYRENHKEAINERKRTYRETNRETIRERNRLYREKNLERLRSRQRELYAENTNRKEYHKQYREKKKQEKAQNKELPPKEEVITKEMILCSNCRWADDFRTSNFTQQDIDNYFNENFGYKESGHRFKTCNKCRYYINHLDEMKAKQKQEAELKQKQREAQKQYRKQYYLKQKQEKEAGIIKD